MKTKMLFMLVVIVMTSFFVTDKEAKPATVFVPTNPFQPSLIFVSKAEAYLSGVLFSASFRRLYQQRLDQNGNGSQRKRL
jgi:hypothetical protein